MAGRGTAPSAFIETTLLMKSRCNSVPDGNGIGGGPKVQRVRESGWAQGCTGHYCYHHNPCTETACNPSLLCGWNTEGASIALCWFSEPGPPQPKCPPTPPQCPRKGMPLPLIQQDWWTDYPPPLGFPAAHQHVPWRARCPLTVPTRPLCLPSSMLTPSPCS